MNKYEAQGNSELKEEAWADKGLKELAYKNNERRNRMMGDSNGVSCKHWKSEMESKTTSGLKTSWKF